MTIEELPFTLPAITSLPGLFSEGMDSPAKAHHTSLISLLQELLQKPTGNALFVQSADRHLALASSITLSCIAES